jgi:hypothetical protein
MWPQYPKESRTNPSEAVDFCLSYENSCDHFLNRIECPARERRNDACNRGGVLNWRGHCSCGRFQIPDSRIAELSIDSLLNRRTDLLQFGGYPNLFQIDGCSAYEESCLNFMDHILCPEHRVLAVGCTTQGDYSSFQGRCRCGTRFAVSDTRIAEDLFDSMMKPYYFAAFARNLNGTFNACASYKNMCRSGWN